MDAFHCVPFMPQQPSIRHNTDAYHFPEILALMKRKHSCVEVFLDDQKLNRLKQVKTLNRLKQSYWIYYSAPERRDRVPDRRNLSVVRELEGQCPTQMLTLSTNLLAYGSFG
jgi:hypothetical protein